MATKIAPTDIKSGTLPSTVLGNTAATGDNDTSLSTTAFVQQEIDANAVYFDNGDFTGAGSSGDPITLTPTYFSNTDFAGDGSSGTPISLAIDPNTKANIASSYNNQTGTTYTLQSSDNGKVVTLSNASAITLTIPTSLPTGFNCSIVQLGAGQVTISASGTTIHNRQSYTKLAGQYACATILMYASNTFVTQGDMAA